MTPDLEAQFTRIFGRPAATAPARRDPARPVASPPLRRCRDCDLEQPAIAQECIQCGR